MLQQLESLLDQFFSPSSTNEQKAEISKSVCATNQAVIGVSYDITFRLGILCSCADKLLENFSQQQGVWRYCIGFLQRSTSQHVLMYSLNLLEVHHIVDDTTSIVRVPSIDLVVPLLLGISHCR